MGSETNLFGENREILEEVIIGNEDFSIPREIGLGRVATEGSSAETQRDKEEGEQKAAIFVEKDPGWQHNAQPNFD